jgi:hypothetical protein
VINQGGLIKNLETKVQRVTELLEQQSEQLLIIIEANRAQKRKFRPNLFYPPLAHRASKGRKFTLCLYFKDSCTTRPGIKSRPLNKRRELREILRLGRTRTLGAKLKMFGPCDILFEYLTMLYISPALHVIHCMLNLLWCLLQVIYCMIRISFYLALLTYYCIPAKPTLYNDCEPIV